MHNCTKNSPRVLTTAKALINFSAKSAAKVSIKSQENNKLVFNYSVNFMYVALLVCRLLLNKCLSGLCIECITLSLRPWLRKYIFLQKRTRPCTAISAIAVLNYSPPFKTNYERLRFRNNNAKMFQRVIIKNNCRQSRCF